MKKKNHKGIVMIEVVIVVSILGIVTVGLIFANIIYLKTASFTLASTKATLLAQEGVEAVKYIRSGGWDTKIGTLTSGATYYLSFSTSTMWSSTTTEEVIDGRFLRSFVIEDVDRDADDDIAQTGTNDPDTKSLTVSVSWPGATGTTTKQIETYITNFIE